MIFRQSCLALLGNVLLVGAAAAAPPPPDYQGGCTDAGCHANFTKFKNVHSPVETGACDACHEAVPDKGHKFQWAGEPDELCLDCHDSIVEDLKFLHGPVAAGTCTSCHDPHASNEPALLTAAGPTLCTNCHTSIQEALASRPSKHAPVVEDCLSCHNPHGGDDRFNLSSQPPELCLDCHDTIADIIEEASVQHSVVTAGRACLTCHDPHASDFGPILKGKPLDLCMSCHEKDQKSETRILHGLGQLLKDKPHHHGPVGDGSCTDCHQPHGGEHFRMLAAEYPAAFYAPFNEERYALCFECHDSDLFLDEKTTEGTGFRNGDQNLHFLHVNRPIKGRTCRACHDPHASGNPFHITDAVRFGKWELPLNFEPQANGGGCQPGCHKRYRYDRTTPVTNLSQ